MTEVFHEGVYGDHSTDGWLEWGLDAHFAERRALEEFTPASNEVAMARSWQELAEHYPNNEEVLANVAIHTGRAALLAAAEARIRHGVQIVGFESPEAEAEFRKFYDSQTQDYAAAMAAKEARSEGVTINGDFSHPNVRTV